MRQELYRNGPSLMPRSLGMTIQASTATTTFPTIQKVAKRLNIIPLLLGGWNSPKYVQTTGILPPTLQKPRLSRLLHFLRNERLSKLGENCAQVNSSIITRQWILNTNWWKLVMLFKCPKNPMGRFWVGLSWKKLSCSRCSPLKIAVSSNTACLY